MTEKKETIRAKNLMLTQQVAYLSVNTAEDLASVIEALNPKPIKYAAILHDKDVSETGEPVEPHFHAMMSFDNARSLKRVAKELGVKPQYIEAWDGRAINGYSYLVHRTESSKTRHQYPIDEVVANFDFAAAMTKAEKSIAATNGANIETVLNGLYEGFYTLEEAEILLTGSQLGRYARQLEQVFAKRLKRQAKIWRKKMHESNRSVTVIWIFGLPATGKTTLAKVLARRKGEEFFVSGSSKDHFQNYNGEHTMILEELRPGKIPYEDLLRITDPFAMENEVMAPSRYFDKAIACDLIIITTPYDPYAYYKEQLNIGSSISNKSIDRFDQLLRRLTLVIEMRQAEMLAVRFCETAKSFVPIEETMRTNPYSALNRTEFRIDPVEIYEAVISDAVSIDLGQMTE